MLNNIGLVGLLLMLLLTLGYYYAAFKSSWKGKLFFKNPHNGKLREAPIGFSWTTHFFWFFPALFRGHWLASLVMLFIGFVTGGLAWLVFPFLYNKFYVKNLIKEGFVVINTDANMAAIETYLGYEVPMLSAD